MKRLCLLIAAVVVSGAASAEDLFGPVTVDNLIYYDGLTGAQFSKLPSACKNKSRWVINFNFDGERWDLANTAYIRKAKVYLGVTVPANGVCDIWAISTAPFSFAATKAAGTDVDTHALEIP